MRASQWWAHVRFIPKIYISDYIHPFFLSLFGAFRIEDFSIRDIYFPSAGLHF